MNLLHLIFTTVLELLKAITYKWIVAIVNIIKRLIGFLKEFHRLHKLPHDQRNATNSGCGTIDHPSFHRADPLIYSQNYLQGLGLAVTWDNPDIVLLKNGVIVSETGLQPNTEYEIDATIWNNSFDAPVVGMPVNFSFLSFGAGTTKTPIGSQIINLGVKGGANHPAHSRIKWITPPAGHYCIQVDFDWDDDLNPANNMGQNNVDVQTAHSPAIFHFSLKNNNDKPDHFHFEIDTYKLPPQTECKTKIDPRLTKDLKWKQIQDLHRKQDFPVPIGWSIELNPSQVTLQPGQSIDVEASFEPPSGFTGEQVFNIHAISRQGQQIGGVTLTVIKS